jgi:hypothetical protein
MIANVYKVGNDLEINYGKQKRYTGQFPLRPVLLNLSTRDFTIPRILPLKVTK